MGEGRDHLPGFDELSVCYTQDSHICYRDLSASRWNAHGAACVGATKCTANRCRCSFLSQMYTRLSLLHALAYSLLVEHPDQLLLNQAHIRERGKSPHTTKDEVAGAVGAFDVLDLRNGTLGIG